VVLQGPSDVLQDVLQADLWVLPLCLQVFDQQVFDRQVAASQVLPQLLLMGPLVLLLQLLARVGGQRRSNMGPQQLLQ
jgi:hypothetical protein